MINTIVEVCGSYITYIYFLFLTNGGIGVEMAQVVGLQPEFGIEILHIQAPCKIQMP